jgi:16S rRNA (cytosine967-C5)-methyltransferase
MSISPARTTAFDILLQVEKEDAYASELLHSSQYAALSPEDHGLATQIVMGVLRWRSQLDAMLAPFSKWPLEKLDAEVLTSLRMGAYQLTRLERVPAHAAVHESVELVKRSRRTSAAGLVNALLRKVGGTAAANRSSPAQRTAEARASTPSAIAAEYAHPEWLVTRWLASFGAETTRAICVENQRVPATHIRLRETTGSAGSAPFDFVGEDVHLSPGSLLAAARRVESGDITRTQAFRNGRITIQDEASQLVALLVGRGSRILDACAAPGGKTAILAERNPEAAIVALDVHRHRTRLLEERVKALNVTIITADLRNFPVGEKFDRVLVDAPCTGTGTLAHHPEIKWQLRAESIRELQALQVELMQAAMRQVAPGGTLLYSTCSLEPEECEQVVEKALGGKTLAAEGFELGSILEELSRLQNNRILTASNIERLTQGPYLRTYPGAHPCDGFFAALLRKLWR